MSNRQDTAVLFLNQIGNHTEELATLIALGPTQPIEPEMAEKALRSTSMLVNSAAVLELEELCAFFREYEGLLGSYFEKRLLWDERIAQVTSELIELEDQWVTAGEGKTTASIHEIYSVEQLTSLTRETAEIRKFSEDLVPPQTQQPATPESPDAEIADRREPKARQTVVEIDRAAMKEESAAPPDTGELAGSAGELQRHTAAFIRHWEAVDWNGPDLDTTMLNEMRKELFAIGFHALSIEQLIGYRVSNGHNSQIDSLKPVLAALQDFSRLLVAGGTRSIDVNLIGEANRIDVRLLMPVVKILQGMIADTATKCEDTDLRIDIVVQEQNGSLIWSFRDNGKNHLAEHCVDPVEYVDFYPSLRETTGTLAELYSLLWVEPDEKHETRFAFSLPVAPEGGRFVVWRHGEKNFAVLSNQISDVLAKEEVKVESNAQGEYLMHDGYRVPLIHLDSVCEGLEMAAKQVVILGHVDMRVAFYVDRMGDVGEGTWVRTAVSAWKNARRGVAEIEGQRATILEASDLMEHCLRRGTSGTAAGDGDSDKSTRSVATDDSPSRGHVLVVERSESLRNELSAILAERGLAMRAVDQIDKALESLKDDAPVLIISEFRVPSMAAKVLVEKLRTEGQNIPILVTTTHAGDSAESLVQKLGVAGYIGKPLDAADVLARVCSIIEGVAPVTTET